MASAASGARSSPLPPPPGFVKVKRDLLEACMTCPLCHKLLREATTISECLHTFCRKCIFDKLAVEELDYCPKCNIDLGGTPLEKLRPDHSIQDIRAKIFPSRKEKNDTLEVPSVPLPVRIKERSLSSLVVNAPQVARQTGLTGRRTKASRRAASLSGFSSTTNESIRKEDDGARAENSNSFKTLSKTIKKRKQNDSDAVPSFHTSNKDKQNGKDAYLDKTELWKPLDCLFEAAKRTKALYSSRQSPIVHADQVNGPDSEVPSLRTNLSEHPHKSKVQDDKNGMDPISPLLDKTRRLHGVSRRRRELGTSVQAQLDAASGECERKIHQFWFSLVAAADQEGSVPLKQLRARYLRIKDGSLPVSFVQKYLAKKLDIANEYEVEIICGGQAVSPLMTLQNLVDLWFQAGSSHKIETQTGSSGKDLVMVLGYRHKAPAS